jgi:hypothetical protein
MLSLLKIGKQFFEDIPGIKVVVLEKRFELGKLQGRRREIVDWLEGLIFRLCLRESRRSEKRPAAAPPQM